MIGTPRPYSDQDAIWEETSLPHGIFPYMTKTSEQLLSMVDDARNLEIGLEGPSRLNRGPIQEEHFFVRGKWSKIDGQMLPEIDQVITRDDFLALKRAGAKVPTYLQATLR